MGGILVDHHLNGWAKENEQRIRKCYPMIHSIDDHAGLHMDSTDRASSAERPSLLSRDFDSGPGHAEWGK